MQKPINFDQIWLEDRDKEKVIPAKYMVYTQIGGRLCFDINPDGMRAIVISADMSDYGSRWRAWAHKPTDEERKAAEWR